MAMGARSVQFGAVLCAGVLAAGCEIRPLGAAPSSSVDPGGESSVAELEGSGWLSVQIAGPDHCARRPKWSPCAYYFSTSGTIDVPQRWRAEARVAPIHGTPGLAVIWCHTGVCRVSPVYVGALSP